MQCVFFDIDDTLLDHGASETAALRKFMAGYTDVFGCNHEAFIGAWIKLANEYRRQYEKGLLTFDGQRTCRMTQLFRLYKHTITPEQAREKFDEYQVHYEKNLALYPDVIACLESLKTTKLGIISNGKSRLQMKKLEDTGIIKYFEVFAIAETAGFKKPDKGIFEYACAMAKCAPAEAVFIGDKLEVDAIAGKNAGLKTFWLNRSGNGSFMIQGLREISGLENLKNVLTEEPIRPKNICFMPDDIG